MLDRFYASNEGRRVRKEIGTASNFAEPLAVLHQYRDSDYNGRFEQLTKNMFELEDSSDIVTRRPKMEKQGQVIVRV